LLVRRLWPARALILALAAVTAVGAYQRADRFDQVVHAADRRLQPDVRYYVAQAQRTANPFAAGWKSPLWPALNAPLVRVLNDPGLGIRLASWFFGVLMLPAVGWVMGRLFNAAAGVIVAGVLALDTWLIDLCCEGLREEIGVCLWMLVLGLLFVPRRASWTNAAAAGAAGGALLLLRNIEVAPLAAVTLLATFQRRLSPGGGAAALLMPLLIVSPFYVNQWRTTGDAFAMEKRDARYHANIEFGARGPAGLEMSSPAESAADLYAGRPLSPAAYLLGHRTPGEFLFYQWAGIRSVVMGDPFHFQASDWIQWACTAGLLASVVCRRQRFAMLFVLASLIGMRAHLQAVDQLDERLLLPVLVIWLSAGWWLITTLIHRGLERAQAVTPPPGSA
jgi:hypothetical protein